MLEKLYRYGNGEAIQVLWPIPIKFLTSSLIWLDFVSFQCRPSEKWEIWRWGKIRWVREFRDGWLLRSKSLTLLIWLDLSLHGYQSVVKVTDNMKISKDLIGRECMGMTGLFQSKSFIPLILLDLSLHGNQWTTCSYHQIRWGGDSKLLKR